MPGSLDALTQMTRPKPASAYTPVLEDAGYDWNGSQFEHDAPVTQDPYRDEIYKQRHIALLSELFADQRAASHHADPGYEDSRARMHSQIGNEVMDERATHDYARLPMEIEAGRQRELSHGQTQSDVYWQPGQQSMREDQQRVAERMAGIRYVQPAQERGEAETEAARIAAGGRTGAAAITGASRTNAAQLQAQARELAELLARGDFKASDPDSVTAFSNALRQLQQGFGGGGTGAPGPTAPPNGAPAEGTRGTVQGQPAVWHNAGPQGAGWYRDQ